MFAGTQAFAYDALINGIYYNFSGTKAIVTNNDSFGCYSGEVIIPSSVVYGGKTYSVTGIGESAFAACKTTRITVPKSVKTLGEKAFCGCSGIVDEINCDIPSCSWGDDACPTGSFALSSITEIVLGEGVTHIGECAFIACDRLMKVTCRATNVPTLGGGVFAGLDGNFSWSNWGVPLSEATLYVPASALNAYKNADQWKDFGTILPIEEESPSSSLIGTWKRYFGQTGQDYIILTFTQDGKVRYQEYDGGVWQHDETYNFIYSENSLKIYDSNGRLIGAIQVLSLTSTELKLYNWPDYGEQTFIKQSDEQEVSTILNGSIIGQWNMVSGVITRYENDVMVSQDNETAEPPYDRMAFYENGVFEYLEYSNSSDSYHEDGNGTYTIVDNKFVYGSGDWDSFVITSFDGSDNMVVVFHTTENKGSKVVKMVCRVTMQRVTGGGGEPSVAGEFQGTKRIFGDSQLKSSTCGSKTYTYHYDDNGFVTQIDRVREGGSNKTYTISYSDDKIIVSEALGGRWVVTLGSNGYAKELVEYNASGTVGDRMMLTYNAEGQLTLVDYGDGDVFRLTYSDGDIIRVTESGKTTTYSYEASGQDKILNIGCVMEFDNIFAVDMDDFGLLYYMGALGKPTTHLPLAGTVNGTTITGSWTFDDAGRATKAEFNGSTISWQWSENGSGQGGEQGEPNPLLWGTWRMNFGSNSYVLLTFSEDGKVRYQEYDHNEWQTDVTYNYTYSNSSLRITDSTDKEKGVIAIVSLTSTTLQLQDWPDGGVNTFTKQDAQSDESAVLNGSIVGQWNMVSGVITRYENDVMVSQDNETAEPPYDRMAFYENGVFEYLEYSNSSDSYHEDGNGTYTIVDNKFVYGSGDWDSFVITSFDGSDNMVVVFHTTENKGSKVVKMVCRVTMQRVTDGGGDPDPEMPGEFLGAKRIFGDNLLQSYTRDGKTYTFSYDSNGFVTKVERKKTDGTTKTYTITYGDKIVVRSSSSEVWTATLNSDGFIGTLEVSGTSISGEIAHTSFTYNADGQLTLVNCDDDEMFRLDYTDGDITRSTFYRTSGSYSRYYDYSYETSSQGKILNTGCVMAFQEIYAVDMEDDECLLYYIGALGKPTKHLPLAGSISGMTITGSWILDDAGRATKAVFNGGSISWTWADNGSGGQGGDEQDESAALIGTWKKYFGQSGQNYIILTFSQDGKVRYQEYDGGVWQHDDTYTFTYSGNSLKIYDSNGSLLGTIQVLNLTSTELKLYNWPDYGEQTFTKQSQEQEASAILNGSIIGQWNIVSGTETRYENGVQVSQQGGTLTPPYDRFAFYENGTFEYLEHNSSGEGHHEDGSGTYSIVDKRFVYGGGEWDSFVIISFDGSNSMEVVFRYRRSSSGNGYYEARVVLQRVTDGGGDPDPEMPGEFLGAKRIFGDNLLQSYTRDGKTYTFSYDSNGFVTKVERKKTDGTTKTYTITYGDKIVVRSSSSEVWTATLNSDGFIGTLEVSGTSISGEIAHTSFTYNADGQLTLVNCDDDEMFRLDYTDGDITRSTFYRTSGSYSRYYDYSYETSSQGKILNTGCVMAFQEIYAVDMEDDECLLYYIGALGKPTKHLPLAGSISGMTITGSWILDDAGRATKAVFNGGSISWTWADNGSGGQGGDDTGNKIDGIYYSFTESEAVVVAGNTAYRGKVVIPSSVTYEGKTYPVAAIGENAFQNCTGLTAVSIPASVWHIQKGAFNNCAFQTLMIKCTTPPTLEAEGIFRGATGTVYVLTESYESYLSDDDWKVLGSSIKPFETVTTKLPSHKWSQANYKVVAMSFDATEDYGSQSENNPKHNVIVGTPSKDANGRDWYAIDYQCDWEVKTAPLNHWCEHNGDIYVRRVFCYDRELPAELFLACGNDDAPCEYYLNGELIWSKSNGWYENEIYQMSSSQIALLKPGELNVLAFHVHQNWGGMYADSGLYPDLSKMNISYQCGDNLTWSLDGDTGTLTISGTGRMNDYGGYDHRTNAPWTLLLNSIKHIDIQSGVTNIGNSAFYGCGSLTSIHIPESVRSIGSSAFRECTRLTDVTIPFGLTSIESDAFRYCSSLTTVVISESVSKIEWSAFSGCSSLTDVYCYAETLPETRSDVFNDSPIATATLHVPESSGLLYKTTSPWSGFGTVVFLDAGADGLACVDGIYYSLSRNYATVIAGDTKYTGKVVIPTSVNHDGKTYSVTSIGENAFQNCTDLTMVFIPASIWNIQKGAFRNSAFETLIVKCPTPPILDAEGIFLGATGTVYVPSEAYETYLSDNGWKVLDGSIKPFDIVTTTLPSAKWSQAKYKVVAVAFDSGEDYGSQSEDNPKHNVIVGTPSKDANGREWYAPDYQCEWEVKTAPLNNWCEHNGDIYVRRVFFYDRNLPTKLFLACGNDDAPCEYYLNGELIWSKSNGWFEKEIYQMNSSQIALLKPGELNVLAYHVHQNWGGMYADSGLYPEWSMETLSYQCGDNLTWSFDGETGTLTISGTGRMRDYGEYDYRTNAPWCLILNSIKHIEIQPGVTSIGNSAFYGCDILTSVIISENVKSIGSNAFRRCTNLTDVYCYAENVPETGGGVFDELPIERATLRVFQNSLDQYRATSPWSRFGFIVPVGAEKCAEPTISYSNGELTFNCETEGVEYHYNITDDDIESGVSKTVKLTVTYHITVYATKPNFEKSEVVHGTLCWIDQQPSTEGIVQEDAVTEVKALPVLVQSHGGVVFVQGVPEGTMVVLYGIDGKSYGSTIAEKDGATLRTNIQSGSVVIVKVGEKAFKVRL